METLTFDVKIPAKFLTKNSENPQNTKYYLNVDIRNWLDDEGIVYEFINLDRVTFFSADDAMKFKMAMGRWDHLTISHDPVLVSIVQRILPKLTWEVQTKFDDDNTD